MPKGNKNDLNLNIPTPKFDTAWELITLSIKVYLKCFWFIAKVYFFFVVPIAALKYLLIPHGNFYERLNFDISANALFLPLVMPTVIYGVARYLKSKTFPSIGESYRFGLSKWAAVWVKYFKAGFIILLGLLFLIVPGIYLSITYFLIGPIVCFEGNAKVDALTRCHNLTSGKRGLILTAYAGLFVTGLFVSLVLGIFLAIPAVLLNGMDILETVYPCFDHIFYAGLTILSLLLYLKLRKERKRKIQGPWFLRWAI